MYSLSLNISPIMFLFPAIHLQQLSDFSWESSAEKESEDAMTLSCMTAYVVCLISCLLSCALGASLLSKGEELPCVEVSWGKQGVGRCCIECQGCSNSVPSCGGGGGSQVFIKRRMRRFHDRCPWVLGQIIYNCIVKLVYSLKGIRMV